MSELFFFFSADDLSIPNLVLNLGYSLVVNRHYDLHQPLLIISDPCSGDELNFRRFYVLPELIFGSDMSIETCTRDGGTKFRYIQDHVGAAVLDLILYAMPTDNRVCVGSVAIHRNNYKYDDLTLVKTPDIYIEAYRNICGKIKLLTKKMSNRRKPSNVYIFPAAMELLLADVSRLPWPSVNIR